MNLQKVGKWNKFCVLFNIFQCQHNILTIIKNRNFVWLDAAGAMISSLVFIKWSVGLLKESGKSLPDL